MLLTNSEPEETKTFLGRGNGLSVAVWVKMNGIFIGYRNLIFAKYGEKKIPIPD